MNSFTTTYHPFYGNSKAHAFSSSGLTPEQYKALRNGARPYPTPNPDQATLLENLDPWSNLFQTELIQKVGKLGRVLGRGSSGYVVFLTPGLNETVSYLLVS